MNTKAEHDRVIARAADIQTHQKKKPAIDKFQVTTARFIDTLHGHLSGNHAATSIDNARAVCELMLGLTEYLKKSHRLPADISLIYSQKIDPANEPSTEASLTDEMYKASRKRSNFAKHADRDADSTLSFDAIGQIDHLIFNMALDYETFHCALIKHKLLNTTNEKLYPIKRSLLMELDEYKKAFSPDCPQPPTEGEDLSTRLNNMITRMEFRDNEEECMVPAGAAACSIFRNRSTLLLSPEAAARKMKELGVWPVNTDTNAILAPEPENLAFGKTPANPTR